jgi:hypothetical protein
MRSKFLQQILDETPEEVDKKVIKWADQMKRTARYEARRGVYHRQLARIEVIFKNIQRSDNKDNGIIFSKIERVLNFNQQEID